MTQQENSLHSALRERVGPLTLQLPTMDVQGLGTCFIVGALGGSAIAITARHCIDEASKYDVPDRVSSAPGSPFQVERRTRTWNRIELGTALRHRHLMPFMSLPIDVDEAYSSEHTDVAFLLLRPSDGSPLSLDRAIPLCSGGPSKGERVLIVGFFETDIEATHHIASGGRAAFTRISGKFQVVEATVTDIFENGIRDMRWPCFQIDCPLFSGMSGGCVLVQRGGEFFAAGVISRDISYANEASGEQAFAVHIWPALTTSFPEKAYQCEGETTTTPLRSILDFIKVGVIKDLSSSSG